MQIHLNLKLQMNEDGNHYILHLNDIHNLKCNDLKMHYLNLKM